jgi:iron complex outermembrane receptor protein
LKEEETVSIASRYDQPISEAPSNVYVITDEDIRMSGAPDLPTVLRRIPGVEVMQTTGTDFNVSVRGDNQLIANKLLVMVDGRSIYIDASGTVFWKMIPVTLPEIKRIEVLKGPASAIYGFNAFDGVINIITKAPEEMKGSTVQFGVGEFGTISSAAVHAGTQGRFGYRLSVAEDQNQQWRNREALSFRAYKFNVQTEYSFGANSKMSLSGGLVDSNRYDGPLTQISISSDRPTQGYTFGSYTSGNFSIRAWWFGTYTSAESHTLPLLAGLLQTTDPNGGIDDKSSFNTYNIEAQHSFKIGADHNFTYGMNHRRNTASSTFVAPTSGENRLGFYAQDEWHVLSPLTLIAGVRYDLDTFINPQVSPRVALVYSPTEGHTFRASVSLAYRPPTIDETHLDVRTQVTLPGPFTTTFVTQGSSNLEPERITSYELDYQGWYFKHRLRVRADLFFNHVANLIAFQSTGPAVTDPVIPINSGNADIYGGEVGVEILATRWLTSFANYSYQDFGQTFTGFSRRGMPHQQDQCGATWRVGKQLKRRSSISLYWRRNLSARFRIHKFRTIFPYWCSRTERTRRQL